MDMNKITIGFIGVGKMAEAILSGLKHLDNVDNIMALEINVQRQEYIADTYGIQFPEPDNFFSKSDIIILAVKPQNLENAVKTYRDSWPKLKDKIIISIVAGASAYHLQTLLQTPEIPIVRVMPNTPAIIGHGAAGIAFPENLEQNKEQMLLSILKGLGETIVVPEYQMNAITALSGSGPAYVYTFIQAMIDSGILLGLTGEQARKLAIQTVIGSAQMLIETKREPFSLRGDVSSPGGTTIHGLKVLEEHGFSGIVMNAIEAAAQRAHDLEQHDQ